MNDELIKAIQNGIEICERPFEKIAAICKISENEVIDKIKEAQQSGVIKRFGAVFHHRKLGYTANAMVVWQIDPKLIDDYGMRMARYDFVRLCYQRPVVENKWPYNLFCMIFAKSKDEIESFVMEIIEQMDLSTINYKILYTEKFFKQKGARYR